MTRSDGIGCGYTPTIDERKLEIATTLCAAMLRSGSTSYMMADSMARNAISAAETLIKGCMKK